MATATPLEWLLGVVIAGAAVVYIWLLMDAVTAVLDVERRARHDPARDYRTIATAGWGRVRACTELALVQVMYLAMVITLLLTAPGPPRDPQPVTAAALIIRFGLLLSELLLVWHGLDARRTAWLVRQGVEERGGD